MPISRNLPLNDGLWFLVQNSTDIQSKKFTIPRNSFRAVLEVYVSFHSNDEFWHIKAYNLTGTPGNGPFREVVVRLNGDEIGAVWPFTVVFTGGFSPLIWSPITGIGSFDLPSYDIEITPFLGKILDGKQHEFGFGVTNALNEWYVDANLHIWLDHERDTTTGELVRNENPPSKISLVSEEKGCYVTSAIRSISVSGWVNSSHGNITTNSFQDFSFTNRMTLRGSSQTVNQTIDASHGSHTALSYVSLGFNEKRLVGSSWSPWVSSVLNNSQQGQGVLNYSGSLVTGALGSIQQVYYLNGSVECYFWNTSSSDGTILYYISGDPCQPKRQFNSGFESIRVFAGYVVLLYLFLVVQNHRAYYTENCRTLGVYVIINAEEQGQIRFMD
ncbi:peptide-N4-(N-acetyl-beta-glucosaminyl)asparagine amidase A-like [Papaver somniferum]|uniref:peptide-N4-(N-acetyl-beta- glucosaminyl)asparagine amidase A-like n=1 Tax=Papaver somniferum TaxID=3469 RepID=UPI000E6F7BBB|nr:peptide-N4-(N-acetyl-beta-glucosaminyl)asparagine amidase A-like [Papaver somniferum]